MKSHLRSTRDGTPRMDAMPSTIVTKSASLYSPSAHHRKKFAVRSVQRSLSPHTTIQEPMPMHRANFLKESSHFIHRRLDGRNGLQELSFATSCQLESLHAVTRHTQVDAGLLATCPAHNHLQRLCAETQSRTLCRLEARTAECVARLNQANHSSSGPRRVPTMRLSMACRVEDRRLSSSTRGVHDCAHHNIQLLTVASKSCNRFFSDTFLFRSCLDILQNMRQPAEILLRTSVPVTSTRSSKVPNTGTHFISLEITRTQIETSLGQKQKGAGRRERLCLISTLQPDRACARTNKTK